MNSHCAEEARLGMNH